MLAKNISRPIIGKLARMGFSDPATSPRSPLDAKIQSPKGTKNYDVGGVGLGIVVALEKSDNAGGSRNPVLVRSLSRSSPIPVNQESHNNKYTNGGYREKMKLDWEDYTFVTRHEPNNSYTSTRVYRDTVGRDRRNRNIAPVFDISPADEQSPAEVYRGSADFLSCCQLCQKKLHGKDIYMYRGEKAYCSTECRYEQIVMDERKEKNQKKKYSSSRSSTSGADISSSPYPNNGQMFYTGILAV